MTILSPLETYFLALMLSYGSPGKSVLSREVIPECGRQPDHAACKIEPVCEQPSSLCASPSWSESRQGWARAETREHAAERFSTAARALVRTATYLTRCTDEQGLPDEACVPVRWPEGPRSLASAGWAVMYWESGMREDIWAGRPPVGRGADGEGCAMQIMPAHAKDVRFSQWLERSGIVDPKSDDPDMRHIASEDAVQMMLGTDYGSLSRCFETGLRILVRKRWNAVHACHSTPWSYSMFAFYGTGNKCSSGGALGDWAADRDKTYRRAMAKWPAGVGVPQWAVAEFGQVAGYDAKRHEPSRERPFGDRPSRATDQPLVIVKGDD